MKYTNSIKEDIAFNKRDVDTLLLNCPNGFSTYTASLFIKGGSIDKIRQMLHYLADVGLLIKRTTGLNSIYWQIDKEVYDAFIDYINEDIHVNNICGFIERELTPTKKPLSGT